MKIKNTNDEIINTSWTNDFAYNYSTEFFTKHNTYYELITMSAHSIKR